MHAKHALFVFVPKNAVSVHEHFGVTHFPSVVELRNSENGDPLHRVTEITGGKKQLRESVEAIIAKRTSIVLSHCDSRNFTPSC